jgi:hypothetical protein
MKQPGIKCTAVARGGQMSFGSPFRNCLGKPRFPDAVEPQHERGSPDAGYLDVFSVDQVVPPVEWSGVGWEAGQNRSLMR